MSGSWHPISSKYFFEDDDGVDDDNMEGDDVTNHYPSLSLAAKTSKQNFGVNLNNSGRLYYLGTCAHFFFFFLIWERKICVASPFLF